MYASHFGLHRPPFNNTPDPAFYYSTPDHEEALATLEYATLERKGFVLVTGEVGAGKTLIGRMFLRRIESRAQTAIITHTHLSGRQLLAAICSEFELDSSSQANNLELTQLLQNHLLEQFARDRSVIVLLDEAQNLPEESFEELRMLSNLEADDAKLLQICFLGQPELRQRFAQPRMKQLKQRLFRQFHLPALTLDQTAEYIRYRLAVAGCKREALFAPEAVRRIFTTSQGIPRVINQICDNALLAAYAQGANSVDDRFVREVLERDGQFDAAGPARAMPESRIATEPQDADRSTSSNERTDLRIEQIYGAAPSITQVAGTGGSAREKQVCAVASLPSRTGGIPDAPGTPATAHQDEQQIGTHLDRLQHAVEQATDQWRVMRKKMKGYETNIASAMDESSARCRSTQEQIEAVSRSSVAVADLEEVREAHQAQSSRVLDEIARQRQAFEQFVDRSESRWARTHQELTALADKAVSSGGLSAIESKLEGKVREIAGQLDQYQGRIDQLVRAVRQQCDQTSDSLDEICAASERKQAQAIAQLSDQLAAREGEIHSLSEHVTRRLAVADEALGALELKSATPDDLERLRTEQAAALSDAVARFTEQTHALRELHDALARQSEGTSTEHNSQLAELSQRVAEQARQLQDLRSTLLKHFASLQQRINELVQMSVTRREIEEFRQAQADQDADLRAHLDADRAAVSQALETVSTTKANTDAVDQLRAQQQEDVSQLLQALDDQRREMNEQLEYTLSCWVETQERIERVSAEAAQAELVDELRQQLLHDKERMLELVASQRRDLESQVDRVSTRCQQLLERVNELPEDVAGAEDLKAVQAEHARQIRQFAEEATSQNRQFRETIKGLATRIDQARQKLEALACRAASVEDVKELRDEQKQIADSIIEQVEQQRTEQHQKMADLDHRCEALDNDLKTLAASTTPADAFRDLAQSVSQDVASLGAELDQVRDQHQKDLGTLAHAVDHTSTRVATLEQTGRPKPVRIKLAPEAGQALADLVLAARNERRQLRDELDQIRQLAGRAHAVAAEIPKLMREWQEAAGKVQHQSTQLRVSAKIARSLLVAMKRCNTALDVRLASPQWQAELERGQKLASQLEQATLAANAAAEQVGRAARAACEQISQTTKAAREQTTRDANLAVEQVGRAAHAACEQIGQTAQTARAQAAPGARAVLAACEQITQTAKGAREQSAQDANLAAEQLGRAARAACEQIGQAAHTAREQAAQGARAAAEQVNQAAQRVTNNVATRLRQLVEETNSASRAAAKRFTVLRTHSEALATKLGRAIDDRQQMLNAIAKNVADLAEVIQPGPNGNGEADADPHAPDSRRHAVSPIEWPKFRTHQVHAG